MIKNAMTDNHGYETPRKGATEWHESLNRNFRYIDRDIEIRDIDAAKTDYRPKSGAKFLATDTEDVYVADGSQWLRLATSGENPSFDTVSAKTLVDRESGSSYSVDQLSGGSGSGGVKPAVDAMVTLEGGTPTAVTADGTQLAQDANSAVVIQEAANHVNANGGGSIVLGTGTFPVNASATTLPGKPNNAPSEQITLYSNMTLRGQGMGETILKATGNTQIGNTDAVDQLHLRDFTYDGNNQGQQTCLNSSPSRSSAIRVAVLNCGTRSSVDAKGGIIFREGNGRGRNRIINCYAENCSYVSISTQKISDYNQIRGCIVKDPNTSGGFTHPISAESNGHSIVTNNTVIGGGDPAINVNGVDSVTCANNTVEDARKGINIANGGGSETVVSGNTISDCNTGIRISVTSTGDGSLTDNLIVNNTVRDYGSYGIDLANTAHSVIKNNIIADKAGNGERGIQIQPPYYPPDIIGNLIIYDNDRGIKMADSTTDERRNFTIAFNKIVANSTSVDRAADIAPHDCNFFSNTIMSTTAPMIKGDRSIILGNRATCFIGNNGANQVKAFNLQGDGSSKTAVPEPRAINSYNTHASSVQTITLSTGSTPAARVNGVSSDEGGQPIVDYITPVTGTTPAADYAFDHYFEWDTSAGAWDLVIKWQTDPGSNFDVDVQIGRRG